MKKEPRIRDIPSIKKALREIDAFERTRDAMLALTSILELSGIDGGKNKEIFDRVPDLERRVKELSTIPDRFNDIFADRGWIMYEDMDLDVARATIEKAESGDINGAEMDLVNYYDNYIVKLNIKRMKRVKAFLPRWSLAQKALIDYNEERYHACVPIVLAILDGMVSEAHEKGRGKKLGFFAEQADLEAWDSISAHDKGLKALANIFRKRRTKTETGQISIPYRNGILHGMDLGYDNRMVAAKAWGALFATRDWAIKAENGLLDFCPPENTLTMDDVIRQIIENERNEKRLHEWKPRSISLGRTTPLTGGPNEFASGTPEQKLAEFLSSWKSNKYYLMANCIPPKPNQSVGARIEQIKCVYESKHLKSFQFRKIYDQAASITVIQTDLSYDEMCKTADKTVSFRLVYKDLNGEFQIRGTAKGCWYVLNWDSSWL